MESIIKASFGYIVLNILSKLIQHNRMSYRYNI